MTWFRSRLLQLLIVALLITSIPPLVVLGAVVLQSYQERGQQTIQTTSSLLDERSLNGLETRAIDAANSLASFLKERENDLRTLSALPRTQDAYLTFAKANTGDLWTINPDTDQEIHINLPLYREVSFIDPNGLETLKIVNTCTPYPFDCQLAPADSLRDVSNPANTTYQSETYFKDAQALGRDQIYVGQPIGRYIPFAGAFKGEQFPSGQRYEGVIRYLMPVYDGANLQGYVMLALDQTHVIEFIAHLDPTSNTPLPIVDPRLNNIAYVVAPNGSVVAHVSQSNIAGVDAKGQPVPPFTQADPTDGPGNFNQMGFLSPVFPDLMNKAIQQPQGIVPNYSVHSVGSPDLPRALAYATIPYHTGPNYIDPRGFGILIISMDAQNLHVVAGSIAAQIDHDLAVLAGQMSALVVLAIVLAILLAFILAQRVVAPIRNITRYAQLMEQRSLDDHEITRLQNNKGRSEPALLSRTFGKMADTVRTREREIADLLSRTDEALHRRVQELSTLEDIDRRFTFSLEVRSILDFAGKSLLERVNAQAISWTILPESEEPQSLPITLQVGDAAVVGNPQTTSYTVHMEREIEHEMVQIGSLIVYSKNHTLDERERAFASQVAERVSIAVQNTRFFARIQDQQRQLEITNQEIREANRLKSEFLANTSHELRTPLNAMIGFTGIMLQGMGGEFDDDARHMLERIDSNARRLLALINDILNLARIEAGRLEILSNPINPNQMVKQWRSQMEVLATQKNLDFTVTVDPLLPEVIEGDEERISQIVINLLSNAFKFTSKGSVTLALKRQNDTWIAQVTDTGIGIAPHALTYIFDEFRQVDGSSARAYGGSGLGLAIARKLCHLMSGDIQVSSTLGVGSTFTVTLPLKIPALATGTV